VTLRLLLVDDHRMLREGLRRSLEEEGLVVVGEAADGEEAVRIAPVLQPDVILMDVSMPVMDGVEATRRIVAANADARVVMLTMHADRDVVEKALRAGAVGYLTKDCSTEEVVSALHQATSGETVLSIEIARSMLDEVHRLDPPEQPEEERVISKREEEVLQLIADGCSPPEVASQLYISQKTVKNHLASIYDKLDARDRTQAVLTAVRMGIVRLH
jgi:two-component system, NarL family, response regulator DegU